MSTSPWETDPLMGAVLADLDKILSQAEVVAAETNQKMTDLTKVANATAGEVVTVQSPTTRADYTTYFK